MNGSVWARCTTAATLAGPRKGDWLSSSLRTFPPAMMAIVAGTSSVFLLVFSHAR